MRNGQRGRYTLEFKREAVRRAESGQSTAAAARDLGRAEQTLFNWVKAHRAGKLNEVSPKAGVTAEPMEISRLRAELAHPLRRKNRPRTPLGRRADGHYPRLRRTLAFDRFLRRLTPTSPRRPNFAWLSLDSWE